MLYASIINLWGLYSLEEDDTEPVGITYLKQPLMGAGVLLLVPPLRYPARLS